MLLVTLEELSLDENEAVLVMVLLLELLELLVLLIVLVLKVDTELLTAALEVAGWGSKRAWNNFTRSLSDCL